MSYDGEYKLGSLKEGDMMLLIPGVKLMLIEQNFGVCPNGCVNCANGCDVSFTLETNESIPSFVTVSDRWTTFVNGRDIYKIRSTGSIGDSTGQYLRYRVQHVGQMRSSS